jgi:outer membrane protein
MEKELTTELELIQVEFNRKLEEFQKNGPNLTELVKQSREQELVTMNQKLQTFRESAMESLQQENAKLMQPISEKANKAIENVAKEQGITYVLDAQAVHFKSVDSIDLLPQVQLHLGIKKK